MNLNPFDEEYFTNGIASGKSNYVDYRWLPDLTIPYATILKRKLQIKDGETLHDIGCSRGFLVKALNMIGTEATGHDISEWAIANCDEGVRDKVSNTCLYTHRSVDWVHCKDVLEHCSEEYLDGWLPSVFSMVRKGAFFIVPLTAYHLGKYLYPADNQDVTHIIRFTMSNWLEKLFMISRQLEKVGLGNFEVHASYHVAGLKLASHDYPMSTAFLTVRRAE